MDQGLFAKYVRNIDNHINSKQLIITTLFEKTGILLEESEIVFVKKQVSFLTSSVKKTKLIQKGAQKILSDIGYTLQL